MTKTIKPDAFYVVGIGASAGGLEALERFFSAMPDNPGMSFVIIQHLSPDYKSMMAEILSKFITMPVREAEDGTPVEVNHVYLIPPKKTISINGGHLFLTEKSPHRGLSLPIDTFFHSLALDQKERAIGVILSGTGSDGTRGIRSIKENDGMIVVQKANTAKFDGMPSSAINTGLADFILPPENMTKALIDFARHPNIIAAHLENQEQLETMPEPGGEVKRILDIIQAYSHVDFHQYKPTTVLRRIERRAGIRQCHSVRDYLRLLSESETEKNTLYRELLIGVTKFFRDPDTFMALQQKVIPPLFSRRQGNEPIRIWVAGCSTGEEAYTLAILFAEFQEQSGIQREVKIFATDIDQRAISIAANGVYPESIAADVDAERLMQYFSHDDKEGQYTVLPKIRRMVVFACHDLTQSPPFNRLDLISCRNLFIYLRSEMQERILHLFHFALQPSGYLLLGESESIGDYEAVFHCLNRHHKLYETRPGVAPKMPQLHDVPVTPNAEPKVIVPTNTGRSARRQVGDYLQHLVMDKMLPPCILINDELDALYISQQASKYLSVHGIPDYNLARILPGNSATFVRSAVTNALKNNRAVIYKTLDNIDPLDTTLELKVEPLGKKHGGAPLLMLTITESAPQKAASDAATLELSADNARHVEELERELAYTKETLQATIEELETSNEELQSTNEELIASNEELQSTNEELQAVNEELITVNSEHQHKIQELAELNETYTNLLRSSKLGTVFLDRALNIRSFTPAARTEIHLRDGDIGRPFAEIRHHLLFEQLDAEIKDVLHKEELVDHEVHSDQGNCYILRISPFLLSDNSVDGVILTLFNITERKRVENKLAASETHLRNAQQLAHLGSWELDLEQDRLYWSEETFHLFGLSEEQKPLDYETFLAHVHPEDRERVDRAYSDSIAQRRSGYEIQHRIIRADNASVRYVQERCAHYYNDAGEIRRSQGMIMDITARKQAEEALLQSRDELLRYFHQPLVAMFTLRPGEGIISANPKFCRLLGYRFEELQERQLDWNSLSHPDDRKQDEKQYQQILNGEIDSYQIEKRYLHKNGQEIPAHLSLTSVRNRAGEVEYLIAMLLDLTETKRMEMDFYYLFHHSPVAKLLLHDDGTIVMSNHAFERLLGYRSEVLPDLDEFWRRTQPDAKHRTVGQRLWTARDGKRDNKGQIIPFELELRAESGETRYVRRYDVLLKDRRSLTILIDLTESRRQNLALEQAQQAAEAANQAKSAFIANMSHELRTPLNSVLGFAQVLAQSPSLMNGEQLYVQSIYRGGQHLLTLINDILDLAKVESGHVELKPEQFDIQLFATDIVDMFQLRAEKKGIHLDYQPAPSLPKGIYADPVRLRQVIMNLLGNAIKFTNQGKVELKLSYRDESLHIEVNDTGPGIPGEEHEKIFEPFSQACDIHYRMQGTGLGLPITRKIIQLMDGELHLQSSPQQGSRFRIILPIKAIANLNGKDRLSRAELLVAHHIEGYRRNGETPCRLLIVDDVADNRLMLSQVLRPLGFEVCEAMDGEACLALAQDFNPHLVLMDLRMPGLDGLETTARLHQLPYLQTVPVIALSASAFQADQDRAKSAGCIDYLIKPLQQDSLLKILQKHLQLEWIYKPAEKTVQTTPAPPLDKAHQAKLQSMLECGAITEIIDYLEKLSHPPHSSAKAVQFLQLAKKFQLEEIRRQLKADINNSP